MVPTQLKHRVTEQLVAIHNVAEFLAAVTDPEQWENLSAPVAVPVQTVTYSDGMQATGTPPLPLISPAQQDALNELHSSAPQIEHAQAEVPPLTAEHAALLTVEQLAATDNNPTLRAQVAAFFHNLTTGGQS